MGDLRAAPALPALHGQLWDLFPAVRLASVEALQKLGKAASARPLEDALEHRDIEVVRACAGALATIPGKAAAAGLLKALQSSDVDTRRIAATGLGTRDSDVVALSLAKAIADVPAVRKAACQSLAAFGDSAVDALATQLNHALTRVRRDVTQLLSDTPLGATYLATALRDDDAVVRTRAAQGLGRYGTSKQLPLVLGVLRDPNSDVREAAFHAAGALGANREMLVGGLADANLRPATTHELLTATGTALTTGELAAARNAAVGKAVDHPGSPGS